MFQAGIFFSFLLIPFMVSAQPETEIPDSAGMDFSVVAIPIAFYTPDTRWAAGGGAVFTWTSEQAPYPNSITLGFAYTQNKQLLAWAPFRYYTPLGKYLFYGEVGWFDYVFPYFGIAATPETEQEVYEAKYPNFEITALKAITAIHSAGLLLTAQDFTITQIESGGLLDTQNPTGSDGGVSTGLGLVYQLDSRDNRFYPYNGWFVESFLYVNEPVLLSDFSFGRWQTDVNVFIPAGKSSVLATQFFSVIGWGAPPFFDLAGHGGTKRGRGYFDAQYRNLHVMSAQTEYRTRLFWRLGAAAFAGGAYVFGPLGNALWLPNLGGGLRFMLNQQERIQVRADYAVGKNSSGFYLTIGEAF